MTKPKMTGEKDKHKNGTCSYAEGYKAGLQAAPNNKSLVICKSHLWWYKQAVETANSIIDFQKDKIAKLEKRISAGVD